jgi:hypothetical protein
MVLTVAVVTGDNGHTRRRILGVAAGTAVAAAASGCGVFDDEPEPVKPDALQPVLDEALGLAAALDRAALAQPGLATRLTPLAGDHRAHITELSRVIGRPAPPAPAASSGAPGAGDPDAGNPAALLKQLRAAEQAAQRTATTACRQAPAERAALVGSIAACRATHAEALR